MLYKKDRFGLRCGLIDNMMNFRRTKQFVSAIVALLALSQVATAQWPEAVAIASDTSSEPFSSAAGETDFLWAIKNHLAAYQEELDATNSHESMRTDTQVKDDQQKEDRRPSRFDAATIRLGQQFFQSSCTQCHDAERATSKRKGYSAWLATVRRMAAREDADIPGNKHVPIATFLASLNPANQLSNSGGGSSGGDATGVEAQLPPFTLNGTLSTVWRGTDNNLENRGFFPDVWLGVEWRAPENPVSGRVVACTSCHGGNEGLGVELVEASATLDLVHWFTRCPSNKRRPGSLEANLKAGRFIVPFGAYSGRVHPGALRTVSPPLMYNMGRRAGPIDVFQPVLNMPYSDEGANLHLRYPLPIFRDVSATFDFYGVNGLQVGGPDVFLNSRSYRDNNSNTAVGGRATIGSTKLRFGGSIASGELQDELSPNQIYKLAGADVTFRWKETLRAYYEYAIRDEAPFPGFTNTVYGNLFEAELFLLDDPKISLMA